MGIHCLTDVALMQLERVWDDEIAAEAEDHIVPDPCQAAGSSLISDWRITSKLLQRSNVRFLKSSGASGYGLGGVTSPWVTHSLQRGSSGSAAIVSQSDANVLLYTGVDNSRDDRGKAGGIGLGGNSFVGNVGHTGASELLASSTRGSWDDVPNFQLEAMSPRAQSPMGPCDGTTTSDALRSTDANVEQEEEDVRKYVRDDVSEGEDAAATDAVQSGEDGPPMSDMEMAGLGMGSDMEDGALWEYALGSMNEISHLTDMENILLPGFSPGEYGGKSSSLSGMPLWLQSSPIGDEHGSLYAAMVCDGNGLPAKASGPKIGKDKFCEMSAGSHGGGTHDGCPCGHKECKCVGKTVYALMEHDQDSWIGDDKGLELREEPGAGVVLNEEPDTIMSGQDDAVSGQCKDGAADGRSAQSQDQSTSEVAVGDDSEVVVNGVESPMVPTLDSDFPSPFLYFYPKPLRLCEDTKQTSPMVIRSSSGERGAPASVNLKAEKSFQSKKEGVFDGGGGVSATTGMTSRGAGCDNSGEITSQCSSPMEASSCVSPTSSMSASVDGGKGHRARRAASARKKTEEKARRESLQKPGLRSMGTMALPMDSYQLSTQTVPSLLSRPHILSSRAVSSACATSAGNVVFSDVQYIPQQQPQARLMGAYSHNMYISPLQVPLSATGVPFFPHQEAPALHQDQLNMEDRQHKQHLMFGMADMSCRGSYQYTQPPHHSHLASGTATGSQVSSQRILAAGSKGLQLPGTRQVVPSTVSIPQLGQGPVGGRSPVAVPTTHNQRVRYLQFRRLTQMRINQQIEPQPGFQPQQKTLQRIQDHQGQDQSTLEKSKPSRAVPRSGVILNVEEKASVTPPDGAENVGAVAREKEHVLYPILEIPLDDVSVEAVVLRQLESAIRKLDIGTCNVIRDALYRLAESATQRAGGMARMADASANASLAGLSGGDNNRISSSIAGSTLASTAVLQRSMNSQSTSLDTNLIDRKIAELLFHVPARMATTPQGQISVAAASPIMQTIHSGGHISTLPPNLGFTMPPSSSLPGSYYVLSTPSIDSHMYHASSIGHVMSAPQPWMWQQPHIASDAWLPSSAVVGSTTADAMGLGQGSGASAMMTTRMTAVAGPSESPTATPTGRNRNMAARNARGMGVSDIGSPRRLGGENLSKVPPASVGMAAATGTGRAIGMEMGMGMGMGIHTRTQMAIETRHAPAAGTGPVVEASQMGMGVTSTSGGATGATAAGPCGRREHMRMLTVSMDTDEGILSSSHGNHEGAVAANTAALPMGQPGNQGFSSGDGREVAVKLEPTDQADGLNGTKQADREGLSRSEDDSRGGSGEDNVEAIGVLGTTEDSERGWEWEWEGASGIDIDADGDRRAGTPSAESLQGGEQGGGEQGSGVDAHERQEAKLQYNCRESLPAQPPQKQRRVDIGIEKAEGGVGTVGVGGEGCRKY
ncbi:hypothetical protein CBR_g34286 [Chara braunii]|uniref:Uncharacterized protein n=1 Tax=Chara braunii TaxID=69332 RepID=A0A388JYM6_CHABU|nr:hypothetical protein CBR_g34286 [Chara braunii]|eukprot:GBG62914.1 hypothetical protein CBR_g34286 [Chara braunii]